jgi:hypothetical protein
MAASGTRIQEHKKSRIAKESTKLKDTEGGRVLQRKNFKGFVVPDPPFSSENRNKFK